MSVQSGKVLHGCNFRVCWTVAESKLGPGFTFIKNGPAVLYVTISLLIMFGVQRCTVFHPSVFFLLSEKCEKRIRSWSHLCTQGIWGVSAIQSGRNSCTFIKTIQGLNVW